MTGGGWVLEDIGVEVVPGGVGGFDQGEFGGAVAGFELFFAGDGGGHGFVAFEPDEDFAAVFMGEAGEGAIAVLRYAGNEVAGDAGVEGAIAVVGHDVDARGAGLRHWRGVRW